MKRKAKRVRSRLDHDQWRALGTITKSDGMGTTVPPLFHLVQIYFDQKGEADLAQYFFDEQQEKHWQTINGIPIRNWKVCATDWIFDRQQKRKRMLRQSLFRSDFI